MFDTVLILFGLETTVASVRFDYVSIGLFQSVWIQSREMSASWFGNLQLHIVSFHSSKPRLCTLQYPCPKLLALYFRCRIGDKHKYLAADNV